MRLLFSLLLTLFVCACGKQPEPARTTDQIKTEREAATVRTRENPVYGDQLKVLDKAKTVQGTVNKQAEELRDKARE